MRVLVFITLLGLASPALSQDQDGIAWKSWGELEQALTVQPKPVFIFFHSSWCAYCKKMQRKALKNPEVIQLLNRDYYAVTMDVETLERIFFDNQWFENKQAQSQRNGVHELPLILASRDGEPFSLPATLILESDFSFRERVFEYMTSEELLAKLK